MLFVLFTIIKNINSSYVSELEVVDGPNILMVDSNLTVKELILDYIMEIDELKTDLAMKDEYIIKLKKQLDNMAKNPVSLMYLLLYNNK